MDHTTQSTDPRLQQVYAQAHHLELEFYDRFFADEAYLQTHAEHMQRWHS